MPYTWSFTLAGWNTPTTRARINILSNEFLGHTIVSNIKGTPHLYHKGGVKAGPVGVNEWFV